MGRSQSCPAFEPIKNQAAGIWISDGSRSNGKISARVGVIVMTCRSFSPEESLSAPRLTSRADNLTTELFHDAGDVVVLKQADGRDARSSGCEAGTGILQRDSSQGENRNVGEAGFPQK